ncbi:bacterioferritin [Nannocystis bainbridge]|uniref:Bacterioferritin n=1 Tax=Nannocystis bainbridge TaxID=2995303 RepID=A0ABT5DZP5_9BACT|nr:bacterioferritin [Nannocystis bainbridge]MDC0718539.1 bacterioferritin [Nannocystis bainbridge]
MKGNDKILNALNEVLTAELTAINQYFIHAKMCKNWGYSKIASKIRAESIDEMKHADDLIERILFLEGIPNVQRYNKVNVGESVKEQFELDLKLEYDAVQRFNNGIAMCRDLGDNATRELLERMLISEEEHVDWLETQLGLIQALGEPMYCAQQL